MPRVVWVGDVVDGVYQRVGDGHILVVVRVHLHRRELRVFRVFVELSQSEKSGGLIWRSVVCGCSGVDGIDRRSGDGHFLVVVLDHPRHDTTGKKRQARGWVRCGRRRQPSERRWVITGGGSGLPETRQDRQHKTGITSVVGWGVGGGWRSGRGGNVSEGV